MKKIAAICLLIVTACSAGGCTRGGAVIDSDNDLHCMVLASYFQDVAERIDAPPSQRHAVAVMKEWYVDKAAPTVRAQWGNGDGARGELERISAAVKKDPEGMRPKFTACTERAAADPSFDRFARSQG